MNLFFGFRLRLSLSNAIPWKSLKCSELSDVSANFKLTCDMSLPRWFILPTTHQITTPIFNSDYHPLNFRSRDLNLGFCAWSCFNEGPMCINDLLHNKLKLRKETKALVLGKYLYWRVTINKANIIISKRDYCWSSFV